MADILEINYGMMTSVLSKEEIEVLQQYQTMGVSLNAIKAKLEDINEQMAIASPENIQTLTEKAKELQKSMDMLGLVFKSTVHNLLLQVNSNQLVNEPVAASSTAPATSDDHIPVEYLEEYNTNTANANAESATEKEADVEVDADAESANNANNAADEDEDDDLGSGIDEETMDAVDRIQHELAMSADIHRQIADQLEINNPDDY